MYRKMIYFLLLLLPVVLGADFGELNSIKEMEENEYFYLDSEKGCSIQGEYLTYAILGINEETEESWLEVYRSDDGGETFESEELMNWEGLPETAEFGWYLNGENFYFKPQVMTSSEGSLRIFFEDVVSGEVMVASTEEYWGEFSISESLYTDYFKNPYLWQDGDTIWGMEAEHSPAPVCCFQEYMNAMVSVNSSEENLDLMKYWGPDVLEGEVCVNSDIWIQQAGGGTNESWPTFYSLVITGNAIMDFSTSQPAINSAPMDIIFRGGYIQEYAEESGLIELPELAEDVRANGFILTNSIDRDILCVKIDGMTAICRYADIVYEEMEFTVYNSYPDGQHPELAIGDSIWTNVVQVPHIDWDDGNFALAVDNSSVFCWCELWIEGSVSGHQTWASADTVYISNDIVYESVEPGEEVPADCPDMFGLISEKSILIKYKHWDPNQEELITANCDDVIIYGAYAALGVAEPGYPYPGYQEGILTYEYQHPHGSTPDFTGISPYTGNDTLFTDIDFHKYVMPPAEGYTGNPGFILHSNPPAGGYDCCGYPYEDPAYGDQETAPYGTDKPFYNPVYPESSEDIVFDRGWIRAFGSIAQRRRGFSHRSGIDSSNHLNNEINDEEYLYGGMHTSTGYGKDMHYDIRMHNNIYPPDFVKVDNYFKQYSAICRRSGFDLAEPEDMGSEEIRADYWIKLLEADNDGDEFVVLVYYSSEIIEVIYSGGGELHKEFISIDEVADIHSELREVYRDGDYIYIESDERLYRYELGGEVPIEVVTDFLEPEEWHGIEWNDRGDGLLLELAEGSYLIAASVLNEETGEFEVLVSYPLETADFLYDIYEALDFDYHCEENGEIVATFARRDNPEDEYYRDLYQMRGVIEILPEGESEITPAAAGELELYPNPFNPELTVSYSLAKAERIEIAVYNLRGERVTTLLTGEMEAGKQEIVWNGRNGLGELCGSGMYFVQMTAGDQRYLKKAILLK